MSNYINEYFPILVFLGVAVAISLLFAVIPLLVTRTKSDTEKNSAYECGFESFGDARRKFDVQFYLVSILFIIFDLEIAFLFPWAIVLKHIGMFGFCSMMVFLFVLTIGFIYEWRKGALNWQ